MCPIFEKKKDVGLFLKPTLCVQDLQIGYYLEDSHISSILVSIYFTKSIKYFLFISLFMVLLSLHIKL